MSQSRQLAAIMFTDIVGYTKLMSEDEEKAFLLLDKNRLLQKPLIEKYRGQYLYKNYLHGFFSLLMMFALNCSLEIPLHAQVASPIQGGHYMPGLMNLRDFAHPRLGYLFYGIILFLIATAL